MHPAAHGESPSSAVRAITRADAALPRFLAEPYYTVKQIATLWHVSQSKVRELFAGESGLFREGKPNRRIGSRSRRGYFTTRIPESAVLRVHRRLTGAGWYTKLATDQHYTPQQLAAAWRLSDTKLRRMFAEEGGVLRIGEPSRRTGRKLTRRMYTMRIPEIVARRVLDGITSRPLPQAQGTEPLSKRDAAL